MKYFVLYSALAISMCSSAQSEFSPLQGSLDFSFARVDDIYFLDAQNGFACTGAGRIWKTTDGGENFDVVLSESSEYYRSIEFLDENIGLCGSLDNTLYRTEDGGDTWASVPIPIEAQGICGIHALDDQRVFVVGAWFGPAFYMYSEDAGLTWEYVDMSDYSIGLVDVLFLNDDIGFMCGIGLDGGMIIKTTDGGETWENVYTSPTTGDYVWKIQKLLADDTFIYASIESFTTSNNMCKSFDQGDTWEMKTSPNDDMQGIGFETVDHGWIGGHNSEVLETYDGGDTWESNSSFVTNANRFFFLDDGTIYVSGDIVWKTNQTTSISEYDIESRKLEYHVTPNPSSGDFIVNVELPQNDHLVMRIYDYNGRFISQSEAIDLRQGINEIPFDLDIPPGSYVLVFHTNEGMNGAQLEVIQGH